MTKVLKIFKFEGGHRGVVRLPLELDIRSIKQSLNQSHVRCKSPAMVRRELWTTLLGDNLAHTTTAAALLHEKQPRQIRFTATCQYLLASWSHTSRSA